MTLYDLLDLYFVEDGSNYAEIYHASVCDGGIARYYGEVNDLDDHIVLEYQDYYVRQFDAAGGELRVYIESPQIHALRAQKKG